MLSWREVYVSYRSIAVVCRSLCVARRIVVVKCVKVAVHSENIFKRRLDGLLQCTTAALGDCLVYYELRGGISRCLDLRDCARGDSMGIRSTLFLTGARRGTHAGLGVCRRMKWASSHGEQEEESSQVSWLKKRYQHSL